MSARAETWNLHEDDNEKRPLRRQNGIHGFSRVEFFFVFSNPRAGRGWRRTNHGFRARMIPSSWDWQKKAKILQACLQSFCFTLPHSRSECTRAHFFVSVFIRAISGLFFPAV
jgi:hypothetical protein